MKLEYNGDDEDGGGGGGDGYHHQQHLATNENNNNNSYSNMNDENSGDDMNATSNNGSIANLKRKRLCDIAYTAEITFESQQAATSYVDSLCLWKFERNRATKKGSKGFYHCKMAENCKSKIYLLSDPFSPKVVLYQNNIEHEHDPNAPPSTAYLDVSSSSTHLAKKSRSNNIIINNNNNKSDLNSTHVDIVNENDFEDSFVDFFDNENGEYQQENGGWPDDECENENENVDYANGNLNGGGVNGMSVNRSSLLNNTFMNYNMEERFETRAQANDYLEAMYPGVWKFERTRPTKTGAKCFYKCKMSKECKSKCYILSRPNVDECMLYKNNIEHDHTASGGLGGVGGGVATPMKKINSQIG